MKELIVPNRSGPRVTLSKYRVFSAKGREIDGKNITFCKRLYDQYPDLKKYNPKQIRDIVVSFNKDTLIEKLINNREGVQLPSNAGHLLVGTMNEIGKKLGKAINQAVVCEHKIAVPYSNDDTAGNRPWIYYTTHATPVPLKGSKMWAFEPHQKLIKKTYEAYKKNWRLYYVVDKPQYVSMMLRDKRQPKRNGRA